MDHLRNSTVASTKRKQKFYKSHFINGNIDKQHFYKKYANNLIIIKFISEQMYYKGELNKIRNNAFKT